jgi:hypothetical protein
LSVRRPQRNWTGSERPKARAAARAL